MTKEICEVTGKYCFSRKEAGEKISYYKNNHLKWRERGENIPKRSYYCKYCGAYHLTHHKSFRKGDYE